MGLRIKRVVHTHTFNGQPNGESVDWVLFEQGQYTKPMVILADFELARLLDEVMEQQAVAKAGAARTRGRGRTVNARKG